MKKSVNFEKYHGIGNDFIFIPHSFLKNFKSVLDIKKFCLKICHRNYGIGADGVIFYRVAKASKRFEMLIVNCDGSLGATCGNALRCFGLKLFREKAWDGKNVSSVFRLDISKKNRKGLLQDEHFALQTKQPFSTLLKVEDYNKNQFSAKISILFRAPQKIEHDKVSNAIFVQLENPHLVFLSKNFEHFTNEQCIQFGKKIQKNLNANIDMLVLPEKIEAEKTQFSLRVFERGAGLTMACGSGAVASALALRFANHVPNRQNSVVLNMPGGLVEVLLPKNDYDNIILRANAQFVFSGHT